MRIHCTAEPLPSCHSNWMKVSEEEVLEAYQNNREFYDNIIELQNKVEEYKKLCAEQEKKSRNLLILQQKLQIRTEFLEGCK